MTVLFHPQHGTQGAWDNDWFGWKILDQIHSCYCCSTMNCLVSMLDTTFLPCSYCGASFILCCYSFVPIESRPNLQCEFKLKALWSMGDLMCEQDNLKHLWPWVSPHEGRYLWKHLCCGYYVPQKVYGFCPVAQGWVHTAVEEDTSQRICSCGEVHDAASSLWSTSGWEWGHAGTPQSVRPWISPRQSRNTCRGIPTMGRDVFEQGHSLRDCCCG